jgi:hypothetical protein
MAGFCEHGNETWGSIKKSEISFSNNVPHHGVSELVSE